jgi:hypothetical protein
MGQAYIGGNHIKEDEVDEAVERLRSNRPILVLPLNDEADDSPGLKECKTIDEVFHTFKPRAEIEVRAEDGSSATHRVAFARVTDFSPERIVDAVPALRAQRTALAVLQDLRAQIKDNAMLRRTVDKEEDRRALLECLQEALRVLEGATAPTVGSKRKDG